VDSNSINLFCISPELILAIGGIVLLLVGVGLRRTGTPDRLGIFSPEILSIVVLSAALVMSLLLAVLGSESHRLGLPLFHDTIVLDGLAVFFKVIAIVSTVVVAFLSIDYFRKIRFHRGEYYALLVFAALAITSLSASTDLVTIYLSLEFLSITSYILVGYVKQDAKSNEAAIKYFLYGSIAAAVMLYGMSILYGLTGETNIYSIASALSHGSNSYPLLMLSTVMVLAGFGFKVAMVPFHQWTPDTYEGAPTPITAFLSVGSKAAGFAVLVRVLTTSLIPGSVLDWALLLMVLSGITMTVGNLIAIPQTNIKRMLAYSSIAQAGYILLGVATIGAAITPEGRSKAVESVLLYTLAYLFMNLGAFAIVTMVSGKVKTDRIKDYSGLVKRAPMAAVAMAIFMLSLAGIPPTAGFLGKFYLFYAAIKTSQESGSPALLWLAVVAIVNTVISVYYYFNVVKEMFFGEPRHPSPIRSSHTLNFAIGLTLVMTFLIFIFPGPFMSFIEASARMFGM
jgi:proton-translocating NADH-quinone oxidoreductase chain N